MSDERISDERMSKFPALIVLGVNNTVSQIYPTNISAKSKSYFKILQHLMHDRRLYNLFTVFIKSSSDKEKNMHTPFFHIMQLYLVKMYI